MPEEIERIDIATLEEVQHRLAGSLIKMAVGSGLAAKDWVQGGWSRSKKEILDRLDFGLRKEVPVASQIGGPG